MILHVDLDASSAEAAAYRDAVARTGVEGLTLRFAGEPIEDADVLVGQSIDDAIIARAARARWFASWSAGVERSATPGVLARMRRGLVMTNASGIHGPNIAEHVLGLMLAFGRRLPDFVRAQAEARWSKPEGARSEGFAELTGKTLGIVGLGRIGDALAVRARPFGMRVVGLKRDPGQRHDGDAPIDRLYGPEQLQQLLAESDHVCVAVPHTADTHKLFDASRFAQMKRTAYFYNVARGAVVDEPALVAALTEGRIAGAGLDVFEQEPLPASSPLWKLPNVILTPHVAGITPFYFPRAAALFAANLARFAKGEPLANRYDPERGY